MAQEVLVIVVHQAEHVLGLVAGLPALAGEFAFHDVALALGAAVPDGMGAVGLAPLVVGGVGELLLGHGQAAVNHGVILALDAPVHQQGPFGAEHLLPHGDDALGILAAHGDAGAAVQVRQGAVHVVLLDLPALGQHVLDLLLVVDQAQGHVGVLVLLVGLQGVGGVAEVPGLVEHAQHGAGGQLRDVLVIAHDEGVGADDALLELLVQLLVVGLGIGLVDEGLGGIVVLGDVHQHLAVVGAAHQVLHGVDQAEVPPAVAQDVKADVGNAVRIGGVLGDEALDQVEVLVQGLDGGIARPGQHLLLDEERGAVDLVDDLIALAQAVVGDDVHDILVQVLVMGDDAVLLGLDVGPDVRGILGVDVVQQVDQRAGVDQGLGAVAAVEQVRQVLHVLQLQAQGLVQVAGQELKLELDAKLLFDLLVDLVVGSGLVAGGAVEISQGDGFLSLGHREGNHQRSQQRQRQQYGQQFLHRVFSSLFRF